LHVFGSIEKAQGNWRRLVRFLRWIIVRLLDASLATPVAPVQVEIEGVNVNGVDMIKWDDEGKIVEFKVLVRPLKAVNLIHQKMAAMLLAK
jgi:hypothetical protein